MGKIIGDGDICKGNGAGINMEWGNGGKEEGGSWNKSGEVKCD